MMNAGADELTIGEVILRSPEDLKAHMVEIQGEASDFGGLVCVLNIIMRKYQHIKGEETMVEVMKHKKELASLKISEDESITACSLLVVVPSIFGCKITTKSDITYLPTYGK